VTRRFDILCREYRRLCRTDAIKKIHVLKFSLAYREIKNKMGLSDKLIQQEYFNTQNEVLLSLLKKNLSSAADTHQMTIISLVEAYMEKFQKEAHFIVFLNVIDFQETICLLFAFFLKTTNSFHKHYIDFCTLRSPSVTTFASFDNRKFSLVVQKLFHIYNSFKGVCFLPLEFKLNEAHFDFKKVQYYIFTLIWKILSIKEGVSPGKLSPHPRQRLHEDHQLLHPRQHLQSLRQASHHP
jgi:hypothetical protein